MNLDARINALATELRERGTIPCALLGRMARDTECCSRSLAATVEEFQTCQTCRACPRGHELAAMSPLPQRNVLPVAPWPVVAAAPAPRPLLFPTRPASSKAEPAAPRRWIWFDETMPWPPRPTPQATPVARPKASSPERQARLIPAPRPEAPRQITGVDLGKPGGDKSVEVMVAVGAKGAVALSFREIKPKPPRLAKPKPEPKAPRPERLAKPVATCRECGWKQHKGVVWPEPDLCSACAPAAQPVRPRHLDKPRPVNPYAFWQAPAKPAPLPPNCPCVDPRLTKLAEALRELTRDGRMRVSMLDLMRAVGAANYDEAASLVLFAGLRMSQLHGPVQAVLVDHNARLFMDGPAGSEVRQ